VIYAGDSAADELAISRLKGVATTFRVINEDTGNITKTRADYRLAGPGGVVLLLQALEKRLMGKTPKSSMSRASSVISVESRDLIHEIISTPHENGNAQCNGSVTSLDAIRPRTNSFEKVRNCGNFRRRAESHGSHGIQDANLRKKTLVGKFQKSISKDEA